MKKILLETKWVGVGLAAFISLIAAWFFTAKSSPFIKSTAFYVAEEAKAFLPITIENGEITEPQDKIISKEYNLGNKTINVVLNTEVDELNSDEIKDLGLYISRKFVYVVSPDETKIRRMSDISKTDVQLNEEQFEESAKWLETNLDKYMFLSMFLAMLIYIGIPVLIYAGLTQLLIGKTVNADFSRTLRITTLGCLALLIVELLTGLNINILIEFVVIVLLNYYINKNLYQVENKE